MIDAAGGSAVRTLQETGHESEIGTVTTDLNLTFLNPATGSITATGRVLRRSRSLAFAQVDVHDEAGTHVATGRVSFALTSLR